MPRNPALDILRAVAILMVLAAHVSSTFARGTPLADVLSVGGRGVDLFFVLSGFLLGTQLFREANATGTIAVRRFWVRRWLRTLPAYYAVLFATFAQFIVQGRPEMIDWRYVFFLQNYLPERPFLGVTWSLCVEEHFYLIVAPLILLGVRYRWAVLPIIAAVLAVVAAHAMGFYRHRPDFHMTETHVVFEQCGLGVLLAWLAVNRPTAWGRLCRFALPLALVGLAFVVVAVLNRTLWEWWLPDWGTGGWAVIFGSWVLLADCRGRRPALFPPPLGGRVREGGKDRVLSRTIVEPAVSSPPSLTLPPKGGGNKKSLVGGVMTFVALRAYSLYLVHTEAIRAAMKLPAPAEVQAAAAVVLAFVAAEVLYRVVERPFNRLREHWKPNSTASVGA